VGQPEPAAKKVQGKGLSQLSPIQKICADVGWQGARAEVNLGGCGYAGGVRGGGGGKRKQPMKKAQHGVPGWGIKKVSRREREKNPPIDQKFSEKRLLHI